MDFLDGAEDTGAVHGKREILSQRVHNTVLQNDLKSWSDGSDCWN